MKEEWRDIPGFDYYQASSLGRIRSVDRTMTEKDSYGGYRRTHYKGKVLKPCRNKKSGYYQVSMRVKQQPKQKRVHNLVALAFHGKAPPKQEVRHKDGTKSNNKPSNLEYGTRKQNIHDAIKHGTKFQPETSGEKNGRAKLTQEDVKFIRKHYQRRHPKFGLTALGRQFGVDRTTVSDVVNGRSW